MTTSNYLPSIDDVFYQQRRARLEESIHEYLEGDQAQYLLPDIRLALEKERSRLCKDADRIERVLSKIKY